MKALSSPAVLTGLLLLSACSAMDDATAPPPLAREAAIERVEVEDVIESCFGGSDHSHVLTRSGPELVSPKRRLPEARAEHLVDLLLASSDDPQDPLAALAITPETVAAHRAEIAAAIRAQQNAAVGADAQALEAALTYDRIAKALRSQLVWPQSSLAISFRVRVHRGGEAIVAESHAHQPWMLPWKVTSGGRSWFTYSPEVARALAELVAEDAPPNHLLRTGDAYWRDGVWRDADTWSLSLGFEAQRVAGERMYRQLPGWDEARRAWRVTGVHVGNINLEGPSLFLMLERSRPPAEAEPINAVWWWSPLRDDRPATDWRGLASVLARANEALRAHGWLREWAAAGPGREIELHVVGERGYSGMNVPFIVQPVWSDAGMRGEPEFEILLRRQDQWSATLFFGSQDPRAVMTVAKKQEGPAGTQWLDQEQLAFHPKGERSYLLISPDGTRERRIAK